MTTATAIYRNNLVADCDLEASLASLEEYKQTQHHADKALAAATIDSFVRNLQRVVYSVPEGEFQAHIDAFHHDVEEDIEEEGRRLSDASSSAPSSQEKPSSANDDEFEDEDLLNTDALQKAKQLRAQVRDAAREVTSLRDSVLQQVLAEYDSAKTERLLQSVKQQPVLLVPPESVTNLDNVTESLQALVDLFQSSSSNLQSIDQETNRFQEMIDVIQQETSESRTLSQTEVAITSRDHKSAGNEEEGTDDDGDSPFDPSVSPSELLAKFLM